MVLQCKKILKVSESSTQKAKQEKLEVRMRDDRTDPYSQFLWDLWSTRNLANSNNWVGLAYLADSYDYIQTVNKSFHEGRSLSVEKMTQIGMDGLLTANYIGDTLQIRSNPLPQ